MSLVAVSWQTFISLMSHVDKSHFTRSSVSGNTSTSLKAHVSHSSSTWLSASCNSSFSLMPHDFPSHVTCLSMSCPTFFCHATFLPVTCHTSPFSCHTSLLSLMPRVRLSVSCRTSLSIRPASGFCDTLPTRSSFPQKVHVRERGPALTSLFCVTGTVSIRVTNHPIHRQLYERTDGPFTRSSSRRLAIFLFLEGPGRYFWIWYKTISEIKAVMFWNKY